MTDTPAMTTATIEVVPYDSRWPALYDAERALVLSIASPPIVVIEHIGSTAVPELRAKPVIDLMAAVPSLHDAEALVPVLAGLDYQLLETGMRNRLFLRKPATQGGQAFHLHLVEHATWDDRKERHMRDYLLAHPDAVQSYGALKDTLAATHAHDSLGYTKAKTTYIQGIIDTVRAERGLPSVDVWED